MGSRDAFGHWHGHLCNIIGEPDSCETSRSVARTTESHWVFAYGSNMHLQDVARWFEGVGAKPNIARCERAELREHRLVFDYYSKTRRGGAANITRCKGSRVWGAALSVDASTLASFDVKEGHPHLYRRWRGWVRAYASGWVQAWVYQVGARHTRRAFMAPSAHYRSLLVGGAAALQLPAYYQIALAALPTR